MFSETEMYNSLLRYGSIFFSLLLAVIVPSRLWWGTWWLFLDPYLFCLLVMMTLVVQQSMQKNRLALWEDKQGKSALMFLMLYPIMYVPVVIALAQTLCQFFFYYSVPSAIFVAEAFLQTFMLFYLYIKMEPENPPLTTKTHFIGIFSKAAYVGAVLLLLLSLTTTGMRWDYLLFMWFDMDTWGTLAAAYFEEIVMRLLPYRLLVKEQGWSVDYYVMASSLFFMLMHWRVLANFDFVAMTSLLMFGMILACLTAKNEEIVLPTAIHFCNNKAVGLSAPGLLTRTSLFSANLTCYLAGLAMVIPGIRWGDEWTPRKTMNLKAVGTGGSSTPYDGGDMSNMEEGDWRLNIAI